MIEGTNLTIDPTRCSVFCQQPLRMSSLVSCAIIRAYKHNAHFTAMSLQQRRFLVRAGIISMTAVLIIAAGVLVVSLGWIGWKYWSTPTTVSTQANNSTTQGTTVTTVPHTVQGFFRAVEEAWRPNTKTYAMANGRTLTEYPYDLPVGPLAGAKVYTLGEVPDETTNTNSADLSTNQIVSNDSTPTENTNVFVNTNTDITNSGTESNVNSTVNGNIDQAPDGNNNTNSEVDVNTSLNTNTVVNMNTNADSNVNQNTNTSVLNTNGEVNLNTNTPASTNTEVNTNVSAPTQPEVITADAWLKAAANGRAILKVNWFCSAALTHLFDASSGTDVAIGDYTGDCHNTNVSVKGDFLPHLLGTRTTATPLSFRISSEHQTLGSVSKLSGEQNVCVVDYLRNAGAAGVVAAQYTCDDGYSIGTTGHPDDIQFTVYVFPTSWAAPENPVDVLTTADQQSDDDGDGLTYVQELKYNTNPNNSDTDYDGLGDFEELKKYQTNPIVADSDNDGHKDGEEVAAGYNPLGAGRATDEQLSAWAAAPNQEGKTIISNIAASYADGIVTVSWSVKPNADGIINWGPDATYGQHESDYAFTATHAIGFAATPGQTVHYALRSCTPAPHALCTVSTDVAYTVPTQ